jgi:hypothetical protein
MENLVKCLAPFQCATTTVKTIMGLESPTVREWLRTYDLMGLRPTPSEVQKERAAWVAMLPEFIGAVLETAHDETCYVKSALHRTLNAYDNAVLLSEHTSPQAQQIAATLIEDTEVAVRCLWKELTNSAFSTCYRK